MVFVIGGVAREECTPSLHIFLERLSLRTIHGRSAFCRLVDRALALTEEDKRRFDAASIGVLRRPLAGSRPQRFLVEVTQDEQPATYKALTHSQVRGRAELVALLDVAAGLLILDASTMGDGIPKHEAPQSKARENSNPPATSATASPRFLRWGSVLPEPESMKLSAKSKASPL